MTTFEYEGETLTVNTRQYADNGNTAITLTDADGLPYAHVTRNIGALLPSDWVWISENYAEKMIPVDAMVDAGILTPTEYETGMNGSFERFRVYVVNIGNDNE